MLQTKEPLAYDKPEAPLEPYPAPWPAIAWLATLLLGAIFWFVLFSYVF